LLWVMGLEGRAACAARGWARAREASRDANPIYPRPAERETWPGSRDGFSTCTDSALSGAVLLVALRSGHMKGCRRQGEVAQNVGCLVFQRDEL
jgi:hypothetical protein